MLYKIRSTTLPQCPSNWHAWTHLRLNAHLQLKNGTFVDSHSWGLPHHNTCTLRLLRVKWLTWLKTYGVTSSTASAKSLALLLANCTTSGRSAVTHIYRTSSDANTRGLTMICGEFTITSLVRLNKWVSHDHWSTGHITSIPMDYLVWHSKLQSDSLTDQNSKCQPIKSV